MRAVRRSDPEPPDPPPIRRERLPPDSRRRLIVAGAIRYFAEVGFDGGTRELARRLGVTQPLLYRYFPSKDELIRAVYEELYLTQWQPDWERLLADDRQPLRARLIAFYERYTAVIFKPDWLRIYLFAGLRGLEINRWWMTFVEHHVLRNVAQAMRREHQLPGAEFRPVGAEELELYWMFHGGIFYYGLRREVYGKPPDLTLDLFIAASVDAMLAGMPPLLARLLADAEPIDVTAAAL